MSKSLLILCAGFGKRMLNLTVNTPKPLLKVNQKTLLGNSINFFNEIGFNEIFVNTHYLHYKIESFINKTFYNYPINLIHEPSILGTGGGIKNIFNYTKSKNLCVVNSDIFWNKNNKIDIINFLTDFNNINQCKILLSKKNNFSGLKKSEGDFMIRNNIISNWSKGNEVIFYSGLQVVSKNIFDKTTNSFPINDVWNDLIVDKKLKGSLMQTNLTHVGDKNSFEEL